MRPDEKKERREMLENRIPIRKHQFVALTALLLFAAATFQIADGSIYLGVALFGAASLFSSLAGIYHEREVHKGSGVSQ